MKSLTNNGYAIFTSLCLSLPLQALAQDLPAIDLPPLPGSESFSNDFPPLPGEPALSTGLPPLPNAAPIVEESPTLPAIEVTGDFPELDLPETEPRNDAPPLPNLLPGSQALEAPPQITAPDIPDLAGDDPFADPDFDALFNDEKPQELESKAQVEDTTAAPKIVLPPLPGQEQAGKEAPPPLPSIGLPPLPGGGKLLPPIATAPKDAKAGDVPKRAAKKIKKKSNFSYKVQKLPAPIYQRDYNRNNRHLPVAIYKGDVDFSVFKAAAHDNVNGLRALLNDGRRINMRNTQGDTPLIVAIRANSMKTARLLVARGADVSLKNSYGMGALDIARQQRNKPALTLLSPLVFAQR